MPRGPNVEAFAEKLNLVLARTNMSRAKLAQSVGVDKSVVARWLNGALNPSDHTLTALTASVTLALPGFSRADWMLHPPQFAARIGMKQPDSAYPATGHEAGPALSNVLPGALEWTATTRMHDQRNYTGLWAITFPAATLGGRMFCTGLRIWSTTDAPSMQIEYTNGGMLHQRGVAFAMAGRLWGVMESVSRRDALAMLVLQGVVDEAALVLDGLLTGRSNAPVSELFSVRAMLFRLSSEPDESRLAAVVTRANSLVSEGWERHLTPELLASFQLPPTDGGGPRSLLLRPAEAWTLGTFRLADPARRPQREALERIQSAFADVI